MATINRAEISAAAHWHMSSHTRAVHLRTMGLLERCLQNIQCNSAARKFPTPRIVVAIPVCNEVERIGGCVDSLNEQMSPAGQPLAQGLVRVVLLTNGCVDGTQRTILNHLEQWRVAVTMLDVSLPPAYRNAGYARHLVNHAALDLLTDRSGLLFMTDADSCAPTNWVSAYSDMLRNGYDAIAGGVNLRSDDCPDLLAALRRRGELEDRYTELLDRLECAIDPIPHDPWPRHFSASGANFAMRVEALSAITDFPRVAHSEDKLLARMLESRGCRVRHDCETKIHTSGRLLGRAVGGMADALRTRIRVPNTPCDERLECARNAHFRAKLRRALRETFNKASVTGPDRMAVLSAFALNADEVTWDEEPTTFHAFWERLERTHPRLQRRAITPDRLMAEIKHAERLLTLMDHDSRHPRTPAPERQEQVA